MKYTAALSLAIAPLALAKAVNNVYPARRDGHLKVKPAEPAKEAVSLVEQAQQAGVPIAAGGATEVIIIWANPGANAATTTINQAVTVTQTVTAGATQAVVGSATIPAGATGAVAGAIPTHSVTVGGAAGLAFTPPEIKAAIGDMVVFTFMSNNHSATQSTFATPCDPMAGGMDSAFQPNPSNSVNPPPQVAMQVMTLEPLWFYCRQTGHCGKGMTFSINPSAQKTQAMFQAAAIAQKGQGAGSAITGNGTAPAAPPAGAPAASGTASAVVGTATGAVPVPTGVTGGSGTVENGACVCAVSCGAGSFPAVQAQGIGAFGGFAGGLPANMVEAI